MVEAAHRLSLESRFPAATRPYRPRLSEGVPVVRSEPVIVVEQSFGAPDIEGRRRAPQCADRCQPGNDFCRTTARREDADGVIVRFLKVDAPMLDEGRWRVIGRYGIGTDNVDVSRASALGTAVINVPDYCIEKWPSTPSR